MPEGIVGSWVAGAGAQELLRLKGEYLIPCVYHFYRSPPQIVGGRGCTLIDAEGREYIDCFSGVTVMSAGHCNAEIIEPAIRQCRQLQHTTSIYLTEPVLRLAERLASLAPGGLRRSFFCASGSEAVEGALLLAALATNRPEVVAFGGGLHGRTRMAMSVTGLDMWRTDPFPLQSVHHVPFGDEDALVRVLDEREGKVAAVVGEPVQGNAGIIVPPGGFWRRVREECDRRGVLLVFDEVQTGINRTGRWFACEHWGVVPDVLVLSKALGNGFPIAAFMTTDALAGAYRRPGASTYGGNPVSAAAALATLEFHESAGLGTNANARGQQLVSSLHGVAHRHPGIFGTPRGLGLMIGLPVVGEGAPARCDAMLEGLKDHGVLAGKTGVARSVLTFMPPLTISEGEIARVIDAVCRTTELPA